MRGTGGLLAIAALCVSDCAAQAETPAPYALLPGHIDLARGPDGNTVLLDAPEGLIVVDTGRHKAHADAILERARVAGKPVAAIVNTHWHLDHSTGNRDIRLAYPKAEVIATGAGEGALAGFLAPGVARTKAMLADTATPEADRAAAARRLAAMTDRASFLPAEAVTASGTRSIAGRDVVLHVAPAAVTEADLWLELPDERLVLAGDLVVAPMPFFDTACEEGWARALDEIAAARWDRLIPGHGAPMSRADFNRWRAAFDAFLACAGTGATPDMCTARWLADADGLYTRAEAEAVRALGDYYVAEVLRAPPEQRMAYCRR
ncbi:MAG: MBL fold metallo-hydrolase [Erythrobacter sp.]